MYANAGTTAEDLPSLTFDPIPTPAAPDAPDTLSPSVSALLDTSPVATSVDVAVDAKEDEEVTVQNER